MAKRIKILVACEKSQEVTKAFRDRGFIAYSCDTEPASINPDWHFQCDIFGIIGGDWDVMIAFPPCTHIAVSGSRYFEQKRKDGRQQQGIDFFMKLASAGIKHIAIENPVGIMSSVFRKPDQIIQPWQFGHPESKATCLWLKNLPLLLPTKIAEFKKYRCACGNTFPIESGKYGCCLSGAKPMWDNQTKSGQNKLAPSDDRAEIRGKTYRGIAEGIADQWGEFLRKTYPNV
jgi:hypothetical protein